MSLSGQFFVKNGEKVLLLAPVLLLLLPNSGHCSEKKIKYLNPIKFRTRLIFAPLIFAQIIHMFTHE